MNSVIEHKTFNGGLNTDDSDFILAPDQYRNAINMRIITSENGTVGSAENIRSNKIVSDGNSPVSGKAGRSKVIGTYEDKKRRRLYYFVWNSEGHHLVLQYDKNTDTITTLLDNDVFLKDGVNKGLNFDRLKLITGVDMVEDILFWAQDDNRPRGINIQRLLSGQYKPVTYGDDTTALMDDDLITLERRPPDLPPLVSRTTTKPAGTKSLIKDNAFQFAWRFVYYDGQTTVFSPYSTLVNYGSPDDNTDTINIWMPVENVVKQDVRFVEVGMRYGNTGNFFIIKRWDRENADGKTAIENHNSGNTVNGLNFNFYNDTLGEAVDQSQAVKPFESVPLVSRSLGAAGNRLFLGNNISGYDTPSDVDLSLSTTNKEIDTHGTDVKGSWALLDRAYHGGLLGKNIHHEYAWVLYLSGYPGIKDGYYAVSGVEGSGTSKRSDDPLPSDWFSYPDPVNHSDIIFAGTTPNEIAVYYHMPSNGDLHFNWQYRQSTVVGAPVPADHFTPERIFKTGSTYKVGVVYYDRYLKSSGVVLGNNAAVDTQQTKYNNETYTDAINWAIGTANAVQNIPAWAEYYAVVMTLNLRTRYFLQTFPYEISYVSKDNDGVYQTEQKPYDPSFAGIQIDISSLSKDGLGYVYQKGDIAELFIDGKDTPLSLSIIDQYGKYIVCSLEDIGDLTTTAKALLEIYTPYLAQAIEPFYEISQVFPVTNPGTDTRTYSKTSGFIQGDTWIIKRQFSSISSYGVEAMSPNDKHFQDWFTDAGRPNTLPQPGLGQARKETTVAVSNQYIPKTLINGLCSFDVTNFKDLPDSCGPIRKLVYTSKVEDELGAVMLAICENETVSMYIGETSIKQQTGDAFVAASPDVIGTINTLKGSFGTVNPESVAEKDGHVYWLDMKRGRAIRYSVNGLFPISDYKMKRFFDKRCRDIMALTDADMTDLHIEDTFCYGGFDDYNNEYLIFLPKVRVLPSFLEDIIRAKYAFSLNFGAAGTMETQETTLSRLKYYAGTITSTATSGHISVSYNGETIIDNVPVTGAPISLPVFQPNASGKKFSITAPEGILSMDITELQPNYHEFDNGQNKLLAFKEGSDKWTLSYSYEPECLGSIGSDLYSFKNGNLYLHNSGDGYNTFYGEMFPSLLAFLSNENPLGPRLFQSMTVHAGQKPDYAHIRTEVPWEGGTYHQSTDLVKNDFYIKEGIFYGIFFKDRLSPNTPGTYDQRMQNGDDIRAQVAKIWIEYDEYNDAIELKAAGINYLPSTGHIV